MLRDGFRQKWWDSVSHLPSDLKIDKLIGIGKRLESGRLSWRQRPVGSRVHERPGRYICEIASDRIRRSIPFEAMVKRGAVFS